MICINCLRDLPRTNYHRMGDNPVYDIFTGRCQFTRATAFLYFVKKGIVQNLLHQLKYKDKPLLGKFLGEIAAYDLQKDGFLQSVDLIIPIPLHHRKEKKRGYNQSAMLAEGLSLHSGIPYSSTHLLRKTDNASQTRKSRFERWLNVESVFTVEDRESLCDKHVLLIDDVVTTGSTIEAAVMKLEQISGLRISLFTLAIAR